MADQPKAKSVSLEDFIEIATQAALRAVDAHNVQVELNPQPLPPGRSQATAAARHRPDRYRDCRLTREACGVKLFTIEIQEDDSMSIDDESTARTPLCPSASRKWTVPWCSGSWTARARHHSSRIWPTLCQSRPRCWPWPVRCRRRRSSASPRRGGHACRHFDGASCGLVTKLVQCPPAVAGVPPFALRPSCRWWQQEGKSACFRCPLIVTVTQDPSELLRHAANPDTPPGSRPVT